VSKDLRQGSGGVNNKSAVIPLTGLAHADIQVEPHVGPESRPKNYAVHWVIRIK
jgi:hypothetical protein